MRLANCKVALHQSPRSEPAALGESGLQLSYCHLQRYLCGGKLSNMGWLVGRRGAARPCNSSVILISCHLVYFVFFEIIMLCCKGDEVRTGKLHINLYCGIFPTD